MASTDYADWFETEAEKGAIDNTQEGAALAPTPTKEQIGTKEGEAIAPESFTSWWDPADPEGSVMRLLAGKDPSSETLTSLKPYFDAVGITLATNAAGINHKLNIPGIGIVRVGNNFDGPGDKSWGWVVGGGDAVDDLGDWFDQNAPGPDPYTTMPRGEDTAQPYKAPQFTPPSIADLQRDPGYQARMDAGFQGRERMAAAKGSLLSGGTLKGLERYGQEFAQNEYANLYDRYLSMYNSNTTADLAGRNLNEQRYNTNEQNNQNQYSTRYRVYRDAIDDRFKLANLGLGATSAGAPV